jgi:hypothetical protein
MTNMVGQLKENNRIHVGINPSCICFQSDFITSNSFTSNQTTLLQTSNGPFFLL